MQLAHWNPIREMDDFFNKIQHGFARPQGDGNLASWAPAVDISESGNEYLLQAELAGINKDDVKLTVDNGVLTLSGERHFEKDTDNKKHHRVERYYGAFERSFSLPEDVQADKISAECKDGVISIHLPRTVAKKVEATQIKVQ